MLMTFWIYIKSNSFDWFFSTFAVAAVIFIIFKKPKQLISDYYKRKEIYNFIMKNNRPRLRTEGGHIEPYADRFLFLWCMTSNKFLKVNGSEAYHRVFGTHVGYSTYGIDTVLKNYNLVEITNEQHRMYEVRVIRNKFNESLYKKCKGYLIRYMGDDAQEYIDLEKNIK